VLNYVGRRTLQALVTLFLLSIGVFMILRLIPGDPVVTMLGEQATAAQVEAAREMLGLKAPLWEQYWTWLTQVTTGHFGFSFSTSRPVSALIATRFPVTLVLATLATIVTIVVSIPAGIIAAVHKGRLADRIVLVGSLLGISVPSFFLGIMLMLIFALQLTWFPVQSVISFESNLWGSLRGFVLPALALGAIGTAIAARMTRASMLEVLSQDYILTAKASGLSNTRVRYKYALKNALIPVVTVISLQAGALLGGSVITEQVFNLPGLGTLLLASIDRRDYPTIQVIVLLVSVIYIAINLFVDLLYGVLDPRVRHAKH
jgi:peptide/nickel transport system permease protein